MRTEQHNQAAVAALREGDWQGAATHLLAITANAPHDQHVRGVLVTLEKANPLGYWRAAFSFALERGALDLASAALETLGRLDPTLPDLPQLRERLDAFASSAAPPAARTGAAASATASADAITEVGLKTLELPSQLFAADAFLPLEADFDELLDVETATMDDWLEELEAELVEDDLDTRPVDAQAEPEETPTPEAVELHTVGEIVARGIPDTANNLEAWLLEHLPPPPGHESGDTLPEVMPSPATRLPPEAKLPPNAELPPDGAGEDSPRALKATLFATGEGAERGAPGGPIYNTLSKTRALKTGSFLRETPRGARAGVAVGETADGVVEAVADLSDDQPTKPWPGVEPASVESPVEAPAADFVPDAAPADIPEDTHPNPALSLDEWPPVFVRTAPAAVWVAAEPDEAHPRGLDRGATFTRPARWGRRFPRLLLVLAAVLVVGVLGAAILLGGQGTGSADGAGQAAPSGATILSDPPTDVPGLIAAVDLRLAGQDTGAGPDAEAGLADLAALRQIAPILTDKDLPLQVVLLRWLDSARAVLDVQVRIATHCAGGETRNCAVARMALSAAEAEAGEARRDLCALTDCPPTP